MAEQEHCLFLYFFAEMVGGGLPWLGRALQGKLLNAEKGGYGESCM